MKDKIVVSNIRQLRQSKGITQTEIANKLSISQNAYSKIELGYTDLTLKRLYQIAQILGINAKKLMP